MANQFTQDPSQDPKRLTFASSANQGGGMPNMDPGKMAYNPNDVGSAMSYFAGRGSGGQDVTPFTDALGRNVTRIAGVPGSGPAPAAPTVPSSPNPFQGQPGGSAGDPNALDDSFGNELKARAGGKRSPGQLEADAMEAAQAREQAAQVNRARLARYGFAPSSALGLSYANQTDRQVAELMDRRQMQRETQARSDYMTYLSANEAKRQALQKEDLQRQQIEAEKQRLTNELAIARAQNDREREKGILGALNQLLGISTGKDSNVLTSLAALAL